MCPNVPRCSDVFTSYRVQSYFTSMTDFTDNCLVNVFPVGDKFIATTESDIVHIFSPDTLDTEQKVCIVI